MSWSSGSVATLRILEDRGWPMPRVNISIGARCPDEPFRVYAGAGPAIWIAASIRRKLGAGPERPVRRREVACARDMCRDCCRPVRWNLIEDEFQPSRLQKKASREDRIVIP